MAKQPSSRKSSSQSENVPKQREREGATSSTIVGGASEQAGALVGTTVVVSRKIAGLGAKGVTTAKDMLVRPVRGLICAVGRRIKGEYEEPVLASLGKGTAAQESTLTAKTVALQSNLTAAQRELVKARSQTEDAQLQLKSQLKALRMEKEDLVSARTTAKREADETKVREDTAKIRVAELESDLAKTRIKLKRACKSPEDTKLQPSSVVSDAAAEEKALSPDDGEEEVAPKPKERKKEKVKQRELRRGRAKTETPGLIDVKLEKVRVANFSDAAQKIIFARALSDIGSDDPAVRLDATSAMGGIRHELSVKALISRMKNEPYAHVRQGCIKALTTLKMTEGIPAVEGALTDEAASVRLAAVWGLYHLAGAESSHALIRMLSDENEQVRCRVATCIGWLDQAELAVALQPLLTDSSVSVRRSAVQAMCKLRSREVVSALIKNLHDPDLAVRKAVNLAIETITGKKMSKQFPTTEMSIQRLIARWREWWKQQHPES